MALPVQAAARPRTPVVMVVFDELPVHSLLARNGRIDRDPLPELRRPGAGSSTWYANATTASDATKFAIPAILDGRTPSSHGPPRSAAIRTTSSRCCGGRATGCDVHEEATDLCPYKQLPPDTDGAGVPGQRQDQALPRLHRRR